MINKCIDLVVSEETVLLPAKANKKCTVCGKNFSFTCNLNVHMVAMHSVLSEPVKCTKKYCTSQFDTMYEMVTHRSLCAFKCGGCGKEITKNYRIKGHIRKCVGKE